jgi:hypothetical protein
MQTRERWGGGGRSGFHIRRCGLGWGFGGGLGGLESRYPSGGLGGVSGSLGNRLGELLLRTVVDGEEAGVFLREGYELVRFFGRRSKWFFHNNWNRQALLATAQTVRPIGNRYYGQRQ